MFFIALASAEVQSLKPVVQGDTAFLKQSCTNCTYVNISVYFPDGSIAIDNKIMSQNGFNYNYSFTNTTKLGSYIATTCGDVDGVNTCVGYDFDVTPSGQTGNSNIVFFIFVVLLVYGITAAGFFGRNIPITVLGGMAMMFLGVYLVSHGIIIYRDNLTNYVGYLTISLGVITTFWALLEQFEVI